MNRSGIRLRFLIAKEDKMKLCKNWFSVLFFLLCLLGMKMYSPASQTEKLKFAFITCSVEAKFFEPLKKGMEDAAAMLDVHCDFMGTQGVDLNKQVELIRDAMRSNYAGIAVNIIHPHAFDQVIQEAADQGIPVVGFNTDDHSTPNARMGSVNQNLFQAGRSLALHVLPLIPQKASVLLTMHDQGISALEDRLRGIKEVLAQKNVQISVLISGNDSLKGMEKIAGILKAQPEIKIVICTGQADTEAAGRAIEKYFAGKNYWAAGFDLSSKTLDLIDLGHILCTIDQQPYVQGFYPVVQLAHYLRFGLMPADMDAGASVIGRSDIARVREWSDKNIR